MSVTPQQLGQLTGSMEKQAIPAFMRSLGMLAPKVKPLGLLATPRAKQLMALRRQLPRTIQSPDRNLNWTPGIFERLFPRFAGTRGTYESRRPFMTVGNPKVPKPSDMKFMGGQMTMAAGAPKRFQRHELIHGLTDMAAWSDPKAVQLMPWHTKPATMVKRWQNRLRGIVDPTDYRTWSTVPGQLPWWKRTASNQLGGLGSILDEASAHYGQHKNPLMGALSAANVTFGPGAGVYGKQTMRQGSLPLGLAQMGVGFGGAIAAGGKIRDAMGFDPPPTFREQWDSGVERGKRWSEAWNK